MYGDCGRYSTGMRHGPTRPSSPTERGRRTAPRPAGQMPAITRSSELLPVPFSPVMIVCKPLQAQRREEGNDVIVRMT